MNWVCTNCNNNFESDSPFCDHCNSPDHVREATSAGTARADGATGNVASFPQQPYYQPSNPSPAAALPQVASTSGFIGLAQLEEQLSRDRQAVVLLGLAKSGKSHIVRAFVNEVAKHRDVATTDSARILFDNDEIGVGGTGRGTIWYQLVDIDHRHYAFVDAAGEDLESLMPRANAANMIMYSAQIDIGHLSLLHKSAKALGALIIVVDLLRTPLAGISPWRRQEDQLSWLLGLLRWLRYDTPEDRVDLSGIGQLSVAEHIMERAAKLPQIDCPVLVLFSKADLLPVETTRQPPLRFARRHLSRLHAALISHTKEFRYDFVSTMRKKNEKEDVPIDRPRGVLLSFEWLLFDSYRRFGRLPARWLMAERFAK